MHASRPQTSLVSYRAGSSREDSLGGVVRSSEEGRQAPASVAGECVPAPSAQASLPRYLGTLPPAFVSWAEERSARAACVWARRHRVCGGDGRVCDLVSRSSFVVLRVEVVVLSPLLVVFGCVVL